MPRYAIYYCPAPTSPLWQFGCAVLGYDSSCAMTVPYPETEMISAEQFARWAERPCRYGFHATLKAPFHLRPGVSEAELTEHVQALSTKLSRVALGNLEVIAIGAFVALTAASSNAALSRLASECVDHLEPIRAPLSQADRERRLAVRLSTRQVELLDLYGYPFVHEEFRFHMTLTGPLDSTERRTALEAMKTLYALIDQHTTIDAITLARQDHPTAKFVIAGRYTLATE